MEHIMKFNPDDPQDREHYNVHKDAPKLFWALYDIEKIIKNRDLTSTRRVSAIRDVLIKVDWNDYYS